MICISCPIVTRYSWLVARGSLSSLSLFFCRPTKIWNRNKRSLLLPLAKKKRVCTDMEIAFVRLRGGDTGCVRCLALPINSSNSRVGIAWFHQVRHAQALSRTTFFLFFPPFLRREGELKESSVLLLTRARTPVRHRVRAPFSRDDDRHPPSPAD